MPQSVRDLGDLQQLETGHPPAECGIKTKAQKRRHDRDSFYFFKRYLLSKKREIFCILIIPIDILAFNAVYDIFFYGKKKHKRIFIME